MNEAGRRDGAGAGVELEEVEVFQGGGDGLLWLARVALWGRQAIPHLLLMSRYVTFLLQFIIFSLSQRR